MIFSVLMTPHEAKRAIGRDLRAHRLAQNLTQKSLAARSGVSAATLKRIETSGTGSLENVLLIACALGLRDIFTPLLLPPRARSIDDIVDSAPARQRASPSASRPEMEICPSERSPGPARITWPRFNMPTPS